MTCSFSVIIPVLNEEREIRACIAAVRMLDPAVEIVVADGGSSDATARLAREAGALVCVAPRGRGPQCNAGAAVAAGDVLLFLHADTRLPPEAFTLLHRLFADKQVQIAKFRLSFDISHWLLGLAARCMWVDSLMTSYGDQGIIVRRSFFAVLGGFPAYPLFEDVRIFQLARRRTRVRVVPARIVTSARRFRRNGIFRQLCADLWYMAQYVAGVPPQLIAEHYEQHGAR